HSMAPTAAGGYIIAAGYTESGGNHRISLTHITREGANNCTEDEPLSVCALPMIIINPNIQIDVIQHFVNLPLPVNYVNTTYNDCFTVPKRGEDAALITVDSETKVYPNPVTNVLIVELNIIEQFSKGFFRIFDITGNELMNIPLNENQQKLEIKSGRLANGIYLFKIEIENKYIDQGKFSVLR
ncbi:MAG: T9SS type A sorting domain-containing protein, partial [Bacteroidetes bacterium]|nr:T9SS type A sorting domain-containing protein [Bacteroidota bacterium]